MKRQEIRHVRVVELRNRILKGATMEELKARCTQWGVSAGTTSSYIDEAREPIIRAWERKN